MPAPSSTAPEARASWSCPRTAAPPRTERTWRLTLALLSLASTASAAAPVARGGGGVFDIPSAQRRAGLGVARIQTRRPRDAGYAPGLELRWQDELSWERSAFAIRSSFGSSLRIMDDALAFSMGQSAGSSGLRLGALQVTGGVGVSLFNVSWDDGLGVGMFWPRSFAGVSFDVGRLRVDVTAHVEYLWSWFGDDHFVRGLGLSLFWSRSPVAAPFE